MRYQLKEIMLSAISQNFLNNINKKLISRQKSLAIGFKQEYLFNGKSLSCHQKITYWQLLIIFKSLLIKMSLSLTISSVNSSLPSNSWTISMIPNMVTALVAKVGSKRILNVPGLHLISSKSDSYLWGIRILRSFFCLHIVVEKYCLNIPEMLWYMTAKQ